MALHLSKISQKTSWRNVAAHAQLVSGFRGVTEPVRLARTAQSALTADLLRSEGRIQVLWAYPSKHPYIKRWASSNLEAHRFS